MSKKYGTFTSEFLTAIGEATGFFSWPLEGTNAWVRQQMKRKKYAYDTAHRLKKQGLVQEISRNGKKFLELTKQGQLELLLRKAVVTESVQQKSWDGKWRLVIFDIPEDAKTQRDRLRNLLKLHGFVKLQASVFISPTPLNRQAIEYLKSTGLIVFIRFGRLDELDDDKDLKKKFGLLR